MPKVSVLMPAYNHEPFVAQAIQSVLDQQFTDFEFLIVDDASSDRTVDEIRKFRDTRIKVFLSKTNKGGCQAVQEFLIDRVKGEYIAFLCSDDAFLPGKLEKQVEFLDTHKDVAAVFSLVNVVNEAGEDFNRPEHFYNGIFQQPNRTRFEWLNRFLKQGNCLCFPSVMIRAQAYGDVGGMDPRFFQLSDFDLWIRLCLGSDIHILQEPLTMFRVRDNETNMSGNRPETRRRILFEERHILRNYFKISSTDDVVKIFPEVGTFSDTLTVELVPFYLAQVALECGSSSRINFALDTIFELLGDRVAAGRLRDEYGFTYKDLIRLAGERLALTETTVAQLEQSVRTTQALSAQITEREKDIRELRATLVRRETENERLSWRFHRTWRKESGTSKNCGRRLLVETQSLGIWKSA